MIYYSLVRPDLIFLADLQDWEQGRRRLEVPIRAYLAVIQRDPEGDPSRRLRPTLRSSPPSKSAWGPNAVLVAPP
mgnify:CR=1 FL=1